MKASVPRENSEATANTVATLCCVLDACRNERPDAVAYAFIRDDLSLVDSLTRGQLAAQAAEWAVRIEQLTAPGDRVALVYPAGLDFVRAFWACLLCGRIAVPVPAPDPARFKHSVPRLRAVFEDAQASLVLSTAEMAEAATELHSKKTRWLVLENGRATSPLDPTSSARERYLGVVGNSVAYLQYTSGSTGTPRGVMITHANVIAQCSSLKRAGSGDATSRLCLWLPHYHDYGLVFGVLLPPLVGATSYLMSPLTFLRRPLRWLGAIDRYRITHTGAPNFAYAACVRALGEHGWNGNLDCLENASCGAEPIHPEVGRRFIETFAAFGLRSHTFSPAYGMAETVLDISLKPAGRRALVLAFDANALEQGRVRRDASVGTRLRELVGCGEVLPGLEVRIVDPDTGIPSAVDAIGEIWVRGDSVGLGYWGRPERSAGVFDARLADGQGPFLRTGDLGFYSAGELFIAGRLKDLIIIRGANRYPQDIEWTVERAWHGLRAGHGAAFSIETYEGEQLVIVQETERHMDDAQLDAAIAAIQRAVADEHDLPVYAVALVRPGSLARTTSGKIRRRSCRADYLAGRIDILRLGVLVGTTKRDHQSGPEALPTPGPRSPIEQALWDIWSEVLGTRTFGVHEDFFELGGHSLLATQVAARIRNVLRLELPLSALFEARSIFRLTQIVERECLRRDVKAAPLPPVERVSRDRALPLSFSQRRMWLVQRFHPETTAYNMPFTLRFRGALDEQAFTASLAALVERHEAFRTTFVERDGEPIQIIASHATAKIEEIDLRGLPAPSREAKAAQWLTQAATCTFDLARGPLYRIALLRLADDDHVLLWLIHHAIGDLWSAMILLREAMVIYNAARHGTAAALPPLLLEYADYAAWQRQVFDRTLLAEQLAYWRARLDQLVPLALPTDQPATLVRSSRGSNLSLTLTPQILEALPIFSANQKVTPFMTLLACFQVLLARYTEQTDIAVGTPIANRTHVEAEALVGTLVNTLVMRTDLSGDPRFSELLIRVQKTALEAYMHQDLPFETLVEEVRGPRNQAVSPLVQVLFNVLNAPLSHGEFDGLSFDRFEFEHGAAQFDLSLSVDTLLFGSAQLSYATDLFTAATARRLLANYVGLLEQVLVDPEQPISRYAVASAAERIEVSGWNATEAAYERQARADQLFARQAVRTPDVVAVVFGGESVSYRCLASRAWAICHALRTRGISRGALVGLCLERGVDLLAAQLGVLASGAAYVPLDPAYPPERLCMMAEDAQLALLVSHSSLSSILAWPRTLLLDTDAVEIATRPSSAPAPDAVLDAQAADPAYVIYTSGSTGRPKGVAVSHGAVANFLASMAREPGLASSDRLLAVTTLSFDIAVLELLLPLAVGARIVLASRDDVQDGQSLKLLIERHGVNVMQATPATWRVLIEAGWMGSPQFKALIGGEGLPQDLASQLIVRTGELWNMYGPTETTVWSTCWRVEHPERSISIGRPIANTQIYILDEHLQPCPIGVPGELWIGGDGVALGYWNRSELTAERFVANPFSKVAGTRLYRTGDRGRWRHDGWLEHLGRLDFQVKVRGHRIELGEIEANLASHPEVARTVVLAREDRPGDVRLVAYVVPRVAMPDARALRTHLHSSLPEYMIPQHFEQIGAIPLLPNGKIDRKALPAPSAQSEEAVAVGGEMPITPAEIAIAAIWQRLLGVPSVYTTDNFFQLGGHSLLAMRAIAQIEAELHVRITPRRFVFETLAQIAAGITL
jgi:amino acid adenylation domain-containing protein